MLLLQKQQKKFALHATRILQTFVHHVSKVTAFAEHESCRRRFRWCNSHTLSQEPKVVRDATTVEQQPSVADFLSDLFESFWLTFALNFEDSDLLDVV